MVQDNPSQSANLHVPVDLDGIRGLVEPLVMAHGLVLFDIEWTSGPAGAILRVSIERRDDDATPPGSASEGPWVQGVTLDDCVAVSRDLSTALDAAEIIAQHYNLEVSSPGLDRPLRTAKDFARHIGRLAKLRLEEPASDGQMVLRGKILGADIAAAEGDRVAIEVDGKRHEVALDNIHNARLVFELGGQQKKSQRKPRKGSPGRQRKRTGS